MTCRGEPFGKLRTGSSNHTPSAFAPLSGASDGQAWRASLPLCASFVPTENEMPEERNIQEQHKSSANLIVQTKPRYSPSFVIFGDFSLAISFGRTK